MRLVNKHGNYQCACCGYFTMSRGDEYCFDVCPVCFWEADAVQEDDPRYWGGANQASLIESRQNFAEFQACEKDFVDKVRPPQEDELPDVARS